MRSGSRAGTGAFGRLRRWSTLLSLPSCSSRTCPGARRGVALVSGETISARSAPPPRSGRPARVLVIWAATLLVLAGLAPAVQSALNVPYALLSLVMLAPALACTVVLVRPAWMPQPWPRAGVRAVLVASAVAALCVLVFLAVLALVAGARPRWPTDMGGAPWLLFLLAQGVGALSEEIGWRGVVQRCGESVARPAVVSAVAGFLFGATHLGYWGLGILPVLTFASTAMLMSLTITTLFVGSFWQRMIPAVIVHLGLNLTLTSLSTAEGSLGTSPAALAAAVAMVGVAVLARVLLRPAPRANR